MLNTAIDTLCEDVGVGEIGASGEGDANDGACGEGEVMTGPLSPISQNASYDKLSPYANPGELEPVGLTSFAYQIASGMVSSAKHSTLYIHISCTHTHTHNSTAGVPVQSGDCPQGFGL